MREPVIRLSIVVLTAGILILAPGRNVPAETGWWERGKVLFEDFTGSDSGALTNTEIASGLREALRVGTGNVVSQLGQRNGYFNDPKAHIPLPDSLNRTRDTLARIGMSDTLDDLELRMNRAAEAAAPRARTMFIEAIRNMTLDDARRIYSGPEDAATRYFQARMSQPLTAEFTPIVNESLAQVGALRTYDDIVNRYRQIPFVPDIRADLSTHVVDHAITAIFDYLAIEEAAIRRDPAKRTTALLQKVFGQ
ncbi:MAG: DUF4197 domain-containing protein [Gammaproteobacteria bacterium]|nr:DUF4197 domain-containing protein [Gammaproteobacteria bacterium]